MRINTHVGKLKDIIPKKTAALSLTTDELVNKTEKS